ncbi:MAG: redox-sensing transcriptional repressor Rex [Clostridia bacterium]|nr:redox-sensing transcriptional repressor Rex [Clostridia bacterium]
MRKTNITKATLGRLPMYLKYILSCADDEMISASAVARGLGLGEVLVRRDLNHVCGEGRPKIGYPTKTLIVDIEAVLGAHKCVPAILVGAGKLGRALQRYKGFEEYGLKIIAGFDCDRQKIDLQSKEHPILPMEQLSRFCQSQNVHIGILTVPAEAAQEVCDRLIQSGITEIWNFAPCKLIIPDHIAVKHENLALSLAYLHLSADQ